MSGMRAHLANRLRSSSLSAVPPPRQSSGYSTDLAKAAASILYRSPIPSREGRPVFVLNAAAMPDSQEADFDSLLPYVLARLPEEDDLLKGTGYEVVFFAGDGDGSATSKKHRPGWGWFLQAYHVLSRAMRKRLQKLYIVHEKAWVRILTEIFSTIVSPKFRRKIYHSSNLTNLALHVPIENLLIPPSTYLTDRRVSEDIFVAHASGRRAFATRDPFPTGSNGKTRFPRLLRETTSFILAENNVTSEGLFRVPPHSKLRDVLKEAYDRGQKYIVWKDNGVTGHIPPYPGAEHQEEIIAEVDPKDAYSVFMAAALIKAWYASLRQPIFPTTVYPDLKRLHGDPHDIPDLTRLIDLFSPNSEWSLLPGPSREIVVRHLLPLLSAVAARQEQNKMTAENLAVCFAPALLCGPDQIEDAKMSSVIRKLLTQAIEQWAHGLQEACGQSQEEFLEELKLPKDDRDWDDPAEDDDHTDSKTSLEQQISGITLVDNEKLTEAIPQPYDEPFEKDIPPALPPRSRVPSSQNSNDSTKRKPAPPLSVPPRYSTVISDAFNDVAASPLTYAATTDGFSPHRPQEQAPTQPSRLPPRPTQFPDEKKPGTTTHSVPAPHTAATPSSFTPSPTSASASANTISAIFVPKRKALTSAQVENLDKSVVAKDDTRSPPYGLSATGQMQRGIALPGLTMPLAQPKTEESLAHTFLTSPKTSLNTSPLEQSTSRITHASLSSTPTSSQPPFAYSSQPPTRAPTIYCLARPIYPLVPTKSHSLPLPSSSPPTITTTMTLDTTTTRIISPGLAQRMPSFEKPTLGSPQLEDSCPVRKLLPPRKLNLKKKSVEDLRRLFEERAGTATVLVEAGKWNKEKR